MDNDDINFIINLKTETLYSTSIEVRPTECDFVFIGSINESDRIRLFNILSDELLQDNILDILTPDIILNLRMYLYDFIMSMYQNVPYKLDTIKFIIKCGIFDVRSNPIHQIFSKQLSKNDLHTVQYLHDIGFDTDNNFNGIFKNNQQHILNNINLDTVIYLEKLEVNIIQYITNIGKIMVDQNNMIGINYCMDYGADINELLVKSIDTSNINLIKYFLGIGANVQTIHVFTIADLLLFNICITDILSLLVDYGWDLPSNINYLATRSVIYGKLDLLKYLVKMGLDIHHDNDNLLILATNNLNTDIVNYLLESGADICTQNNSILNFYKAHGIPYHNIKINPHGVTGGAPDYLPMFKLLVKNGAMVDDINETFITYTFTYAGKMDEELFLWFVDNGLNICSKKLYDLIIRYNEHIVAILCLQYGINLAIDSQLIDLATKNYDLKLMGLLFDTGFQIDMEILEKNNYDSSAVI